MEFLYDNLEDILEKLTCEEITNLRISGKIDHFPKDKLIKIYSKKISVDVLTKYANTEYPGVDVFADQELCGRLHKFNFSSILSEFVITLSPEQVEKFYSILTLEQLEEINMKINDNKYCWYYKRF